MKMPYEYYTSVKVIAMFGFSILACYMYNEKRNIELIIYVCLALLFQPIFKVELTRLVWNIVDVIAGLGLIISIFINKEKKTNNSTTN
ncbi:MAG TPA: hypothetical protein PLB66_02505 [Bacteroidales bacterium]|nr:hypothetical protein [Bacteroidales bacterium]